MSFVNLQICVIAGGSPWWQEIHTAPCLQALNKEVKVKKKLEKVARESKQESFETMEESVPDIQLEGISE